MWKRIVIIPMRRNIEKTKRESVWEALGDDVGFLSGREVVLCSVSSRRGEVELKFAEHREYCPADCQNQPVKDFKYAIRALVRKHR